MGEKEGECRRETETSQDIMPLEKRQRQTRI